MPVPNGEQVLDALLALGYTVEIADDGTITATDGARTLHGKASQGAIEWADRSATFHVLEHAGSARLRQRVQAFSATDQRWSAPAARRARGRAAGVKTPRARLREPQAERGDTRKGGTA